jgi:nicotinate-nucleotide adenylyltransferase
MKIGIFGGAFNPIHLGHLLTIEEVRDKLQLDKVWFIPTYVPPHKKALISYNHRRNMVLLAIKDNRYFELCEIEKEREGKSWTIETLKELKKERPNDKLYLIIGSDQYVQLDTWKEPEHLKRYAKLVVMKRPGSIFNSRKVKSIRIVDITQVDIASKDIRKELKQGKSIRYKVAEEVYKYIKVNKLYK